MPDPAYRYAVLATSTRRALEALEEVSITLADAGRLGLSSKLEDIVLQLADLHLELCHLPSQAPKPSTAQQLRNGQIERLPF